MNAVDDIKERLNVEDVVGDYVELKRAGKNLKGLSPFTQEKTPSFVVSPEKQIWHCFSSNKGGDMFTFIEEVEGLDFKGALEILARKANIDLADYQQSQSGPRIDKKRLERALREATYFYQQQLVSTDYARDYAVKTRGLNRQAIQDFGIGYAPSGGQALYDHLKNKGYTDTDLELSGLAVRRSGGWRDMFRGRLLVTLSNRSGDPIGFTGRILSSDTKAPKYINTAQTPLYDKSRHVFGLHLAKEAIRQQDVCVLVEGNMDVVATHQFGYKNTVATAGTALTDQQLKQIKRLSVNVALAFDSDRAGLAATLRAIPIAQNVGVQLYVITMPGGKDPDDVVRKDQQAWEQAVAERKYVFDWLIEHYSENIDTSSARGKSELSDMVIEVLKLVRDPVEQEHYAGELSLAIGSSREAVMRKLSSAQNQKTTKKLKRTQVDRDQSQPERADVLANNLLALTLVYPSARMILAEFDEDVPSLNKQQQSILEVLKTSGKSADELLQGDLKDYNNFANILQLIAEQNYNNWSRQDVIVEADRLALSLIEHSEKQNQTKLSQAIRDAEAAGNFEEAERLLEDWHNITKGD